MAVVVPHNQELPLTWTPSVAIDSTTMKRAAKRTPVETKDTKKRQRSDSSVSAEPTDVKHEPAHDSYSDKDHNSNGDHDDDGDRDGDSAGENDGDAANGDAQWPTLARKRQRMTEEERKARHREVQRQFMHRKLAKLDEMRKLVVVLEKQFVLLQLSQERARLEHENDYLHRRVLANPPHWTHEHPQQTQQRLRNAPPPPLQMHHTASHHVHRGAQGHRPPTGMLPWDEILEAVSEANV